MDYRAKIFMNGRSQAVRLPKELRFKGEEVIAKPYGDGVILLPVENYYALMEEAVHEFENDFSFTREPLEQPKREGLFSS